MDLCADDIDLEVPRRKFTYCHNTQNFDVERRTQQRVTAWYGIRLVRDLNNNYINPLTPLYANVAGRKGPGDLPKANCATCHQGAFKPLYGASMIKDYPALQGPSPERLRQELATDRRHIFMAAAQSSNAN